MKIVQNYLVVEQEAVQLVILNASDEIMVDFYDTTETQDVRQPKAAVDVDVVCPECNKQLGNYTAILIKGDRYGRETREYYGWCAGDCDQGYEVVQYKQGNRWHIHKYRYFAAISDGTGVVPSKKWQVVHELPEPAPVVIGPGGDYDKAVDIVAAQFKLMDTLLGPMEKVVRVLKQLKELRKRK